jgi:hypothetical protein
MNAGGTVLSYSDLLLSIKLRHVTGLTDATPGTSIKPASPNSKTDT